jgi:dethiobiotin synthetase/adenosylmethionine--8-amino-7-oxononanoate aminotransferase
MSPIGSGLWRHFRAYQVFGANTDAGKTIFSTVVSRAVRTIRPAEKLWYLKPVSTGASDDADVLHLNRYARGITTQNLYQFDDPVSPHLAAQSLKQDVPDKVLLEKVSTRIAENARGGPGFMLVETAGGPNSPGPSGTLQADLYRPLRMPILFVADWHLGGISTSISAYESLKMRGYDIEGVTVLRDSYYKNFEYFQQYFRDLNIPVLTAPQPPERGNDDVRNMQLYYEQIEQEKPESSFSTKGFAQHLVHAHGGRIDSLDSMAERALDCIWWPFTQHQHLTKQTITPIDSAYGDYFQTFQAPSKDTTVTKVDTTSINTGNNMLLPTLDGSASWWTQGLGHANPDLTMAAAYAAGRYGHVMFAEAINEPALTLAQRMLSVLDNPRLERVFYSDNGSTAMEVAIKMALKATCVRYGWETHGSDSQEVEILGLMGSYHGDTMGAMDLSEPSTYNEKIPWYKGRGHWFECPSVKLRQGEWVIDIPASFADTQKDARPSFSSLQDVFSSSRDESATAMMYERYIRSTLETLVAQGRRFGALVMEPVVLGAGGMQLVDPLFQRTLTQVVRTSASLFSGQAEESVEHDVDWTGLPIVADEVFTGLYRLGHHSSCSLLHIHPDISAHAKLLTGGLLPLSTTLASKSIFEAFLADNKADALLHGHSYTAHAVGCEVANTSIKTLVSLDKNGNWNAYIDDWAQTSSASSSIVDAVKNVASSLSQTSETPCTHSVPQIWSVWSRDFVHTLSHSIERVDSVWALGSVLAISLRDPKGAGYTSNVARGLQQRLLHGGMREWNIHSRVLGNVLYLMTSQTSVVEDVREWEKLVMEALERQ